MRRLHPDLEVAVGISGTGGGFRKFCAGGLDIANASRAIDQDELAACRASGVRFIELPVGYDGIAVVVNRANRWADAVTVTELRRMWEPKAADRVTRWIDVRPDWPDRPLHLFGAGPKSGTFDYFTEAIVQRARASRSDYISSEDDNVLVQAVATDELALGFFGLAYYLQNQDRLKLVAVDDQRDDNGAGAIAPTHQAIQAGHYQPLSRPLFIYVAAGSLDRPEVRQFVDQYLALAARTCDSVGYIPLPEAAYERVRARLAARRTGSVLATRRSHVGISVEDLVSDP